MIYTICPADFQPSFEVSSLLLENDGEILLLLRQPHKPQGNSWGLPAGKLEQGETAAQGLLRETREETGLVLDEADLHPALTVFVRYPDYDFVYHMYRATWLGAKPDITLDAHAHSDCVWLAPEQALQCNLIPDLDECLKLAYNIKDAHQTAPAI